MSDTMKALDEIEAALKRVQSLVAEGAREGFVIDALPTGYGDRLFLSNQTTSKALSLLPTLRAALTPPADDEIDAIRARHENWHPSPHSNHKIAIQRAHTDRATLLKALDAERQRRVEVEGEVADLKQTVIAFAGPVAARYALDAGFSNGELHPTHYDLLARCGARMVDFKRGEVSPATITKETP